MFFRIILILTFLSSGAIAQPPGPTPRPDGLPNNQIRALGDENDRFNRLRSIEMLSPKKPRSHHPLLDRKTGIYRIASDDEVRVLAVDDLHLAKYESFLRQPGTGLVKLSAESSCISDAGVVVATPKCSALKMPGAGTSYSFRVDSYRIPRLADLVLFKGMFGADAVLQQFSLVQLGKVDIEQVNAETQGLQYLSGLAPVRGGASFMSFDNDMARGVDADGFLYRKGHPVSYGETYALRSIAFRGKYLRSIDGVEYDELDFDRRRDILVVFQVVGLDSAGNATIVWKRLKDAESPKLESDK